MSLLLSADLPPFPWKWRQQYILISFKCLLCDWPHRGSGHLLHLSSYSALLPPMWCLPCPKHLTAWVTLFLLPFFIHKLSIFNSSKPKNIYVELNAFIAQYLVGTDLHGGTMLNISEREVSVWCLVPFMGIYLDPD